MCLQTGAVAWPCTWSSLEQISLPAHWQDNEEDTWSCLPPQWAAYNNLTNLSLSSLVTGDQPDLFNQMQQLKHLDLNCCQFASFPTSLCRLSGLQSLDMSYMSCILTQSIVDLAHLSLLTELKFGSRVHGENFQHKDDDPISTTEYEALRGLEAACLARSLPLARPGAWYHEFSWDFSADANTARGGGVGG